MKTRSRTASCVCRNLKVDCAGEPVSVSLCNCLDCQRRTGSAFGVAAFYQRENVTAEGPAAHYSTTSESGFDLTFYFCPNCGGSVYWETSRKPGMVVVAAGAFAEPSFPAPTQSVHDEHRHPWVHLSL